MPTPTKTGYTFNGWQTSDGTTVTSTTQNTTIGDHTLTAIWTAKTYSVTSGANLTGVSVSVNSTGTFDASLSISTSGSATGYNYTFSNIKVYSGTSTSGTLLATINATSGTFTMTGTYYSSVYVYATWSRSAIATTISANTTSVSYTITYGNNTSGRITVTAGGGGGKWKYSVVSATRTVNLPSGYSGDPAPSDPNACVSLSTTGETTGSVVVTCSGTFNNDDALKLFDYKPPYPMFPPAKAAITYKYKIRATSVYNGTTADITLTFIAKTKYYS